MAPINPVEYYALLYNRYLLAAAIAVVGVYVIVKTKHKWVGIGIVVLALILAGYYFVSRQGRIEASQKVFMTQQAVLAKEVDFQTYQPDYMVPGYILNTAGLSGPKPSTQSSNSPGQYYSLGLEYAYGRDRTITYALSEYNYNAIAEVVPGNCGPSITDGLDSNTKFNYDISCKLLGQTRDGLSVYWNGTGEYYANKGSTRITLLYFIDKPGALKIFGSLKPVKATDLPFKSDYPNSVL